MIRPWLAGLLSLVASAPALAFDTPKTPEPPQPILVDLTLKGSIAEDPAPVGLDGVPISDNLKTIVDRIGRAKSDKNVKGLVLRFRDLSIGWAKSHELRQAIKDFRASGKRVYAFLEMPGNADYLVATAADEIVMPEGGWLMIKGLAAEILYKKLFDMLAIRADMMAVGAYKSAGEPYTRTEMSGPFREEMTELLQDHYTAMAQAIATRQGIALDEAKKLIDGGPYTPTAAKAMGLVNRIAYADQLEADVIKSLGDSTIKLDAKYDKKTVDPSEFSGLAGFMKMVHALSGEAAKKPENSKPKVALIYASGMIVSGKSMSGSLLGEAVMGSDTVIKHLRQAEKDKTVKAIVLRVDSPGGSALASDLIWREVVRIEKPIVASMSDVAASGGYYISMGADKVFAEPGTLTGSIGVVGGKIALGGLMEKVGLTTDTITVGKNGTMFSSNKPFTDEERVAMKRLMEDTYRQFVTKAAQGRKMDYARLEALAGGRVYTGRQAKDKGLVDELGTLGEAIAAAKTLGGLSPEDHDLLILPQAPSLIESLTGALEDRLTLAPSVANLVPHATRDALARVGGLARLLSNEPALVILPFEMRVR